MSSVTTERKSAGNAKDTDNQKRDSEAERRKKIEEDVRRRQECEKRAFQIVEKMLDGPVDEETLLKDAFHICPSHYDDITEERAIIKLCGYPICHNPLKNIPKQKYQISTRSNKVYDITTRKNFCGNQCFTASQYFRRQLLTAPLWTRDRMPDKPFKLLTLEATSGLQGDEVISITPELKKEVQYLERLEKFETKSKDKAQNKSPIDPEQLNLQSLSISVSSGASNKDKHSNDQSYIQKEHSVVTENKKDENKSDSVKYTTKESSQVKTESGDSMTTESKMKYLELLLSKRKHLLGKMADIQPIKVSTDSDDEEDSSESGKVQSTSEKPIEFEKLNDTVDMKTGKVSSVDVNPATDSDDSQESEPQENIKTYPVGNKPMENQQEASNSKISLQTAKLKPEKNSKVNSKSAIKILCQTIRQWVTKETIDLISPQESEAIGDGVDQTEFQLKYAKLCQRIDARSDDLDDLVGESRTEGLPLPEKPVPDYKILREETEEFGQKVAQYLQGKTTTTGVIKEVAVEEQLEVHLPTVDSHDQMLIRKKIVMEKINRSMPELLGPLKLSMQEVFSDVRQLLSTFSFSSQNIIFRPVEWTLVCLILLKILARRHVHISQSFKEESAVRFFDILLQSLGESQTTVDQHIIQIILSPLL